MLKRIRVFLAIISILAMTLLFLDFTGFAQRWWGWLAKIQFFPALISLNLIVVAALIIVTLLLGRIYCSILCPLGILQDVVSRVRGWFTKKAKRKNRYKYAPARTWLRLTFLCLFVLFIILGTCNLLMSAFASFIEPYSEYGRIASSIFAPVYKGANNLLAGYAENAGSYAFWHVDTLFSLPNLIVAVVTLLVVAVLAWVGGRTYCNSVCPVGTVLGYISRYSLLKPRIDTSKCNLCKKCARNCKASCIDAANHKIDYTRCVYCMDCLENCSTGAMRYTIRKKEIKAAENAEAAPQPDPSRRGFLTVGAMLAGAAVAKAADKTIDGGLAAITAKKAPRRKGRIVPAGALSVDNLMRHCTACQLCITACPNGVLRPSAGLSTFMQPVVEYEKGYCRPECTACSGVCPSGAIRPITVEEKSSIQIGHAVVELGECLSAEKGISCGNCARHCPSGAITMVPRDPRDPSSKLMPVVNEARCIGCGACENLCPVRPLSAIHVEGHRIHRTI